jgi:hypothetical protein
VLGDRNVSDKSYQLMCRNVEVVTLTSQTKMFPACKQRMVDRDFVCLLVKRLFSHFESSYKTTYSQRGMEIHGIMGSWDRGIVGSWVRGLVGS